MPGPTIMIGAAGSSGSAKPDERTKTMLARVAASGSLWEDAADFEVPDPFDG